MKKILIIGAGLLTISLLVIPHQKGYAAISSWQKSVNIQPASRTDFGSSSFNQSVDKAIGDGVNYITLIIPITQSSVYSTDVCRPAMTRRLMLH